jgi:hypothetical protein
MSNNNQPHAACHIHQMAKPTPWRISQYPIEGTSFKNCGQSKATPTRRQNPLT